MARLTLNRPEARNALSLPLLESLHARADELAARADLSVLVITGQGRAFCAGMDLKSVLSDDGVGPDAFGRRLLQSLASLTLKLRALPQVTVARVNGAAIGGGCGLACVCDVALTHADAKLGFPEVGLGVCPAVVAPWLIHKVGAGRARRILLLGGLMTGAQALQDSLVDRLAPDEASLDALTDELVASLSQGGPHALRATKELLAAVDGSIAPELLARAAELSASVLATRETREILTAKLSAPK
ncbi:MAG: enoyl-CoA hydratase/isomerase family protein [Planctomycetota bacterium]|nr:enoyl-CoA hydratase/isomerase family protein [Planctomycetota bacterium]